MASLFDGLVQKISSTLCDDYNLFHVNMILMLFHDP